MECVSCGTEQLHNDDCHIHYDSPKTYAQYVDEAIVTYQSIMKNYSAPVQAQPPKSEVELKLEFLGKAAR